LSEDEPKSHLKAQDPSTWEKPEDTTWGDHFLAPNRPLNKRQRELARLMAHGKTNQEIAKTLGYSLGRVSVLCSNTKIKEEIEKYRDKLFEVDSMTRLKEIASDAVNVMGDILLDKNVEAIKKEGAAKWVLEKTTGKAAQQIDVTVEGNIGVLLDKLDNLKVAGKALPAPVIDVTPLESGEEVDSVNLVEEEKVPDGPNFDDWLANNF